jgi:CRISPR/Cas system-associated exonuclease Cas4 (RecB family)
MLALSWSRLSTYKQCPLKFHLTYISKSFKEEEKSIHLIKGEQLHKQLEDYILAKNGAAAMPLGFSEEVKGALPYVDKLYSIYDNIYPEAQVACDINWQPAEWFGKNVAWRAIWDASCLKKDTCFLPDWKSGKVYPLGKDYGQLHLSAVIALKRWSQLPEVNAAYVYIEHQKIVPIKVTREELPVVQLYFEKEFEKVQNEKAWEPTANSNCTYCQATKAQCKFSRKL